MLENLNSATEFKYQKLTEAEQASRGILGRLIGVIADFKNPTRNGRRYTEDLWDKTFDNPIMKEKLANRCLFGELGHPADRTEVDMEKIAICMAEPPKKRNDGKLMGVFDILSTPNGRILKTLCDYGCSIGVSSRGSGDTYADFDGQETVDADTFECECWDAVLLPAVKEARMKLVTESLSNKKSLKKALQESLEQEDEAGKKAASETLDCLGIDYKDSSETEEESIADAEKGAADSNGANLVSSLQESLKENKELQKKVLELQEKLSVSYTKEIKLTEENNSLRSEVSKLASSVKTSQSLNEELSDIRIKLEESVRTNERSRELIKSLKTKLSDLKSSKSTLTESVSNKDVQISKLKSRVSQLTESIQKKEAESDRTIAEMTSEISELKQDSEIKNSQYSAKLARCNTMVESFRNVAKDAVSRYIECRATNLGVNVNEIKNKLRENYTLDDVDQVCEELRSYKVNMSKLPFSLTNANISRVALKEDTSTKRFTNPDDVVDSNLFNLIND